MSSVICTCGLLKVKKVGTRAVEGVEVCNNCKRPLEFTPGMTTKASLGQNMVTTLECLPGYRIARSLGVVTELGATSGFTATSKGNAALDFAMSNLRESAARLGANAIVFLKGSPFGAAGGITSAFGGDAVGVLLMGDAVVVEALNTREGGGSTSAPLVVK
jgi:uncharacterized protein YbjQ (UPF0145 family)